MRRPLFKFFLLTYAVAWICWGASFAILGGLAAAVPASGATATALAATNPALALLAGVVFHLGVFAPGIVALALSKRTKETSDAKETRGRAETQELLGRVFKWRVSARWYVFAIAFMPAIKLSVAVVHRVVTGAWPRFGQEAWYLMVAAIVFSTWVQAGEEIGWRGYALPRLSQIFGLAPASVILGIIWATWHLPLFFFQGSDIRGQSFPLYVLQVTALSVVLAWLYWRTGGSLFLTMLLHAAVNNTKDIVPSAVPGATNSFALSTSLVAWLTVALLWIAAAYFLIQMRKITVLPGGEIGE